MENKNFFEEIFIQKIKYSYVIVHNFRIKLNISWRIGVGNIISSYQRIWNRKHVLHILLIIIALFLMEREGNCEASYCLRATSAIIVYVLSWLLFFLFLLFFFSPTMPQLVTFLGNFSSPISKLVRSGPSLSTFVVDDQLRRHEISTLNYLDNRFLRLFFSSSGYDAGKKKIIWKYYQEIIFCHIYIVWMAVNFYISLFKRINYIVLKILFVFLLYIQIFFLEFSFDYIFSELRSRWISINKK